jgi:hypothetical protein
VCHSQKGLIYDERMPPLPNPKATQIDLATWERGPLYDPFSTFTEPFQGLYR